MTFNRFRLIAELTRDEGRLLKPYVDSVGKVTIGVGRNLTDVGITSGECDRMLDDDIARSEADLDKSLPWWRDLDDTRQRVMINMAFNMGIGGLLGFRNTLAAVQAGNWQAAHDGMLASQWARQVGERAQRLAQAMLTGEMPNQG